MFLIIPQFSACITSSILRISQLAISTNTNGELKGLIISLIRGSECRNLLRSLPLVRKTDKLLSCSEACTPLLPLLLSPATIYPRNSFVKGGVKRGGDNYALTIFYLYAIILSMEIQVKRRRKTERNLSIKKMRNEGKTMEEIADYFGITRQRVYQICK